MRMTVHRRQAICHPQLLRARRHFNALHHPGQAPQRQRPPVVDASASAAVKTVNGASGDVPARSPSLSQVRPNAQHSMILGSLFQRSPMQQQQQQQKRSFAAPSYAIGAAAKMGSKLSSSSIKASKAFLKQERAREKLFGLVSLSEREHDSIERSLALSASCKVLQNHTFLPVHTQRQQQRRSACNR